MRLKSAIPRLLANWITLLGSAGVVVSGLAMLVLLVIALLTPRVNPYLTVGIVIELLAIFLTGLILIPIGLYVDRRRRSPPGDPLKPAFATALDDRAVQRRLFLFAGAVVALVAIFALGGQRTISYMDSPKFCGTSCHDVMRPEYEAWKRSPHSNVACVTCHIGPGALAEGKAKLNGTRQLIQFVTSTYERPIYARGHLLPARETCDQCHAPERYFPDLIRLFPHYSLDKDNTPKFNAMLVHIGGLNPFTRMYEGIHSHADPNKQVRFEYFDDERTKIGKITVLAGGKVNAEYVPAGAPQKPLGVRTMDCIDCHNRAAHIFAETPANAVDRALYGGTLDPKMPYIAQVAAELLADTTVPREQAQGHFQAALAAAYQKEHPEVAPDAAALSKAANTLNGIYLNDIYAAMKLGWNEHRSNLGHMAKGVTNPGCFRCHDGEHVATLANGTKKKLSRDCDTCHTGLAFDADPNKFDDTLAAMIPAAK